MQRMVLVLVVVLTVVVAGTWAVTGAQQPDVVIVNEQGTPCAAAASPAVTPVASPIVEVMTSSLASPEASPMPVVLAGCVTDHGTPAP